AHLQARGVDAVLADVGHHQPRRLTALGVGAELLDELDVPPVDVGKAAGVVVAVAAEDVQLQPPPRQAVPLVARHLTRLAADAHRRVGEEANCFGHDNLPNGQPSDTEPAEEHDEQDAAEERRTTRALAAPLAPRYPAVRANELDAVHAARAGL